MDTSKKVILFFAVILYVIAFMLHGLNLQKEEERNYELLCQAYEQNDYDNAKKYLSGINNFSKYPGALDIAESMKHLDRIEYYEERLSEIKAGVWIKNEASDYKYIYEDKDMDPDVRSSLIEIMEWSASGQWSVSDYNSFYREVEKYQEEKVDKKDDVSQKNLIS